MTVVRTGKRCLAAFNRGHNQQRPAQRGLDTPYPVTPVMLGTFPSGPLARHSPAKK
jgi:hypothetical protein